MKKILSKVLALALCLMFLCPAALAQDAYLIGQKTTDLLGDALAAGHILTAETKLNLELDAAALGLSAEDESAYQPVFDVLKQATITGGFSLIDGGVRLLAETKLVNEANGESFSADVALDLTLDGLRVESSVIEGRRVTVAWETLLALAELDSTYIATFTEIKNLLKENDLEQLIAQAIEVVTTQLGPILEMAGNLVQPYAKTVTDFILTLPIEMAGDLHEEGYPPTALEFAITVTQKDLGDLLVKLCDQLAQDTTTQLLLNQLLTMAETGVTTQQLIDEVRSAAAEMTDTTIPVVFFLGVTEEGTPLYLEATALNEEAGASLYGGIFFYEDAELGYVAELVGGLYDAESNPMASFYMGGNYIADAADPNVYDVNFNIFAADGDTPLVELIWTQGAVPVEGSELPEYEVSAAYSVYESETGLQMISSTTSRQGLTANGGEFVSGSSQLDQYVDDMTMSAIVTAETLVEPTADGGVTGYYRVSESLPYIGIKNMNIDMTLGSAAYDPAASAALTTLEIEKLTNDEMNALIGDVMTVLETDLLPQLMKVLPPEVVEMLAAE